MDLGPFAKKIMRDPILGHWTNRTSVRVILSNICVDGDDWYPEDMIRDIEIDIDHKFIPHELYHIETLVTDIHRDVGNILERKFGYDRNYPILDKWIYSKGYDAIFYSVEGSYQQKNNTRVSKARAYQRAMGDYYRLISIPKRLCSF